MCSLLSGSTLLSSFGRLAGRGTHGPDAGHDQHQRVLGRERDRRGAARIGRLLHVVCPFDLAARDRATVGAGGASIRNARDVVTEKPVERAGRQDGGARKGGVIG